MVIDQFVGKAVRSDLVTARGDLADQRRVALCNPAEHKERSLYAMHIEQIEQPVRVTLDSRLMSIPVLAANYPSKRRHVDVILHVDSHGINHGLSGCNWRHTAPATLIGRTIHVKPCLMCGIATISSFVQKRATMARISPVSSSIGRIAVK